MLKITGMKHFTHWNKDLLSPFRGSQNLWCHVFGDDGPPNEGRIVFEHTVIVHVDIIRIYDLSIYKDLVTLIPVKEKGLQPTGS